MTTELKKLFDTLDPITKQFIFDKVICNETNNTKEDFDNGVVNVDIYGFVTEKLSEQLGDVAHIFSFIGITEDHKDFEKIKHYLIIPEETRDIEYYQKELDEKIDKLIETTKQKFEYSKNNAERKYNYNFDRIINNFSYAIRNGNFPKITLYGVDYSILTSSGANACISVSSTSPCFEVKPEGNNAGYFTFGTIRVWEKTKPSLWVRTFVKFFFGVNWNDA